MCLRRFAFFYLTVVGLIDRYIEASFVHLIELTSANHSIDKSANYIRTPSLNIHLTVTILNHWLEIIE